MAVAKNMKNFVKSAVLRQNGRFLYQESNKRLWQKKNILNLKAQL
jgi:hypothetical protein